MADNAYNGPTGGFPLNVILAKLLERASDERWCVAQRCTTCGNHDMRRAYRDLLSAYDEPAVCRALGSVWVGDGSDALVWILRRLSEAMGARMVLELLGESAAGELFQQMLSARAWADEARWLHAARNDPAEVERLRQERRNARAAAHDERLRLKALREAVMKSAMRLGGK